VTYKLVSPAVYNAEAMAHAGGGARFGPDADSDTDAGGPDVHFPAADLDPSVPCRNPLDPAPYPEHERDAMDDVCFPSLFVAVNEGNGGLAEAELKHSWSRLQALLGVRVTLQRAVGGTVPPHVGPVPPPHAAAREPPPPPPRWRPRRPPWPQ
jgi:hypothetical protein